MHTGHIYLAELKDAESKLTDGFEKLVELIRRNPQARLVDLERKLRNDHEKWLEHRTAECDVAGALTLSGGEWPSTYAVQCILALTVKRAESLVQINTCITKHAKSQESGEPLQCIAKLVSSDNEK